MQWLVRDASLALHSCVVGRKLAYDPGTCLSHLLPRLSVGSVLQAARVRVRVRAAAPCSQVAQRASSSSSPPTRSPTAPQQARPPTAPSMPSWGLALQPPHPCVVEHYHGSAPP